MLRETMQQKTHSSPQSSDFPQRSAIDGRRLPQEFRFLIEPCGAVGQQLKLMRQITESIDSWRQRLMLARAKN
jgi:hypothetical protein